MFSSIIMPFSHTSFKKKNKNGFKEFERILKQSPQVDFGFVSLVLNNIRHFRLSMCNGILQN